jgi:uncharacterized small protein (DUF1192 family)
MSNNPSLEERVACLENEINKLKQRLLKPE